MKRNLFARPTAPHDFKVGDKAYYVDQFDIDEPRNGGAPLRPRILQTVGGVKQTVTKVTKRANGAWVTVDTGEGTATFKLSANNEFHLGDKRFGFYLRPAAGSLSPR